MIWPVSYDGHQRLFWDSNYHSFFPHSARKWLWCGWQSWCGWKRLKAGADETYEHHDPPSQAIFKKLKPIYMCLASKDLFQRCLRCATQNAQSFNGLVWSYCPRESLLRGVELIQCHACSLVVLQFNNCMWEGHTGCAAGGDGLLSWRVQHKCTGTEDKMCIRKSEKKIEILHEHKESSRGRSEKEEGKAGKNKLWMRKVQPTKLGPSQQLLVNILLGKWLEMCSFWTKFTSKSCPNLTHRLTLLHNFSEVVGRHHKSIYFWKLWLRPAGSDPRVVCQKTSFLKVSVSDTFLLFPAFIE